MNVSGRRPQSDIEKENIRAGSVAAEVLGNSGTRCPLETLAVAVVLHSNVAKNKNAGIENEGSVVASPKPNQFCFERGLKNNGERAPCLSLSSRYPSDDHLLLKNAQNDWIYSILILRYSKGVTSGSKKCHRIDPPWKGSFIKTMHADGTRRQYNIRHTI